MSNEELASLLLGSYHKRALDVICEAALAEIGRRKNREAIAAVEAVMERGRHNMSAALVLSELKGVDAPFRGKVKLIRDEGGNLWLVLELNNDTSNTSIDVPSASDLLPVITVLDAAGNRVVDTTNPDRSLVDEVAAYPIRVLRPGGTLIVPIAPWPRVLTAATYEVKWAYQSGQGLKGGQTRDDLVVLEGRSTVEIR